MRLKIKVLIGMLVFAVGMVPTAFAAEFVPPADGPVAFRRDKVPLDEETIARLSSQLEILARCLPVDSASNRRGAAQMLALALALNPGNARARQLVKEYQENRHRPEAMGDQLEKSRTRIWQLIVWLESADAGSQGRLLADCLKDVMVVSDPNHPKSQTLKANGEKGAWSGWVSAQSAFEKASDLVKNDHPEVTAKDPAAPPVDETPKVLLTKAQVGVMLWKNTGSAETPKWELAPAVLGMLAKTLSPEEDPETSNFSVSIGADPASSIFERTNARTMRLLAKEYGKLPKLHITIASRDLSVSIASGKKQTISAAAAVLASAAVTGVEPDAIILGQLDETGAYQISSGFWAQIRSLSKDKGMGRKLVIPTDAAPQISALLAMENPAFFMEYEVLIASDFKQLFAFTAKTPPEALAPPFTQFKEIRDRSAGQDLRQYIGNRFIRQRLSDVAQALPAHLSAKLLLLQAEGKRPTLIPRKVLAAELRTAIDAMAWLSYDPEQELTSQQISKLSATYEACRTGVDGLERYVEKADRSLIEKTRDLALEIRSIERAARSRAESQIVKNAIRVARNNVITHAKELDNLLLTESGDRPAP